MKVENIKFKAKRLDNGEWVKGDLLHNTTYVGIGYPSSIFPDTLVVHRVDPSTVCMFTGLKDKNGTPIYEGDTVKYIDNITEIIGNINWDSKTTTFYFGCDFLFHYFFCSEYIVIIGNKFDNKK